MNHVEVLFRGAELLRRMRQAAGSAIIMRMECIKERASSSDAPLQWDCVMNANQGNPSGGWRGGIGAAKDGISAKVRPLFPEQSIVLDTEPVMLFSDQSLPMFPERVDSLFLLRRIRFQFDVSEVYRIVRVVWCRTFTNLGRQVFTQMGIRLDFPRCRPQLEFIPHITSYLYDVAHRGLIPILRLTYVN